MPSSFEITKRKRAEESQEQCENRLEAQREITKKNNAEELQTGTPGGERMS